MNKQSTLKRYFLEPKSQPMLGLTIMRVISTSDEDGLNKKPKIDYIHNSIKCFV